MHVIKINGFFIERYHGM